MPISKITGSAIADDSITSARLDDGTIVAVDLASDAVTTAKIADDAVTTAKIVDDAVTSAKLDTNIDIAGTLDVTSTLTADSGVSVAGVGSVTNSGSNLAVNTTGSYLTFQFSGAETFGLSNVTGKGFYPSDDNVRDLGQASYRWNDIYLGGGVYVGGTGSANYLDDYEEGTWTPVYKGTSGDPTCTYDFQEGFYVKVGRLVTAKFKMGTDASSGGSGNLRVGGLPFTPVGDYSGILGTEFAFATTGTIARLGNGNTVGIRVDDDEGNAVSPSILGNGTNDNRLFGTIIYETDA